MQTGEGTMPQTKLHELADLGQSIWLDYINRGMIESGELRNWIEQGLRGMTSNPSIFHKVISGGTDYDEKIARLKQEGKSTFEIYDELTVADIQDAADHFKPVHEQTGRLDGYVSLEIDPNLANDAAASIKEGKRLWRKVGRPNVMIKVPATPAGFPVIEELLSDVINVNVTLIFSLDQYTQTVEAYIRGLKRLAENGGDLSGVRSVASVFVSRIDSAVDKLLEDNGIGSDLYGKAAVANSRLVWEISKEWFASRTFQELQKQGAAAQRVLWGSTSTKNPAYKDVKYIEELIAESTVNTVPEPTLKAFLDHGVVAPAFQDGHREAEAVFQKLKQNNIRIEEVCRTLLDDGVTAFEEAFNALIASIEEKADKLCGQA